MLSRTEFNQLIQVYPILLTLPENLRTLIQQEAKVLNANQDTRLFDLDSECLGFVMVIKGAIRVSYPGSCGELLLYHVFPGDSCIMTVSCLLGEMVYRARGVAEDDLLAVALPAVAFRQLILNSTDFRVFIFRFFAERTVRLVELIHEVAFERLDNRLARRLLTHNDIIHCTHQQLADDLGTVREVISRYLREFHTRGFINVKRGEIRIINRPALTIIAESD
jgi:CRP/FNR family transcriptional regulator, anaerobic regulatory protein